MGNCFLYKRGFGGGFGGGGGEITPEVEKTASGKGIAIHDSMEKPLKGLRLFGKTTQNGTPSPTAPVPLESVGDGGSIGVSVAGKNLYDINTYPLTQGIWMNSHGGYASSSAFAATEDYIPVNHLRGKVITLNKRPGGDLPGVCFYDVNKTAIAHQKNGEVTAGTPMVINVPEDAVYMRFTVPANTYEIQIELGSTATAYEPYKDQTMIHQTPNGLPGIHVSEGGNYTDENGWQWICDEVDFARGVYVQRVETVAFDGSEAWEDDRQNGRWYLDVPNIRRVEVLCSHFAYRDVLSGWYGHDGVISGFTSAVHRIFAKDVSPSLPEFLQSESRNSSPVTVLYAIDEKETALSAEQLAAYAALHTYSPSTTIFNDADSYMEVKYMAKGG
jgi:hypothetical protein